MKNKVIAVVGVGFVGEAVAYGFRTQDVVLIDPKLGTSVKDLEDKNPDVIFICVPTPMGENGVIDTSIVEKVLEETSVFTNSIVVLKSTVTPDKVEQFSQKYTNFVYNPEFLTERNAFEDFVNPIMHVFGGDFQICKALGDIYEKYSMCSACPMYFMTAKEASFVKYSMNCFLSLKVVFWNQMKDLMEKSSADYEVVRNAFINDDRIGASHTKVPGHDGRKGSSGPCFGKDIPAMIHYSNMSLSILREAWNANCDYRNSYPEPLQREIEQHIKFNKI